jgi:hypothetical protein
MSRNQTSQTGQLSIFDQKIVVIARTTDPETSKMAARAFEENQTKAQRSVATVVLVLKKYGRMTDFQIRDRWEEFWGPDKWSYTLPCKARHWARQAGKVKHAGFGEHQGRIVRTWEIGRDEKFLLEPEVCECCGQKIKVKK